MLVQEVYKFFLMTPSLHTCFYVNFHNNFLAFVRSVFSTIGYVWFCWKGVPFKMKTVQFNVGMIQNAQLPTNS